LRTRQARRSVFAAIVDSPSTFFAHFDWREIGEPTRKALITSLMPEWIRARGVGLYWGLRSFAICSASLVGAGIWYTFGPIVLLHTAFAFGCLGAATFYALVARARR